MSNRKALSGVKITSETQGRVTAVFAKLNVKDHDGDVTVKGAFTDGEEVRISTFNHGSWKSGMDALPVGKGTIKVVGDEAILDAEFFLETAGGRDTFEVVKQMADLQEWSYGYDVLDADRGEFKGERVRFLKSLKVTEVSPVLLGAGIDTRTIDAKGKQLTTDISAALHRAGRERWGTSVGAWVDDFDLDEGYAVYAVWNEELGYTYRQIAFTRTTSGEVELAEEEVDVVRTSGYRPKSRDGLQFSDHAEAVLADLKALVERAAEVKAMRLAKGKGMGEQSLKLLTDLDATTDRLREVMASEPSDNDTKADLERELLRIETRRATERLEV